MACDLNGRTLERHSGVVGRSLGKDVLLRIAWSVEYDPGARSPGLIVGVNSVPHRKHVIVTGVYCPRSISTRCIVHAYPPIIWVLPTLRAGGKLIGTHRSRIHCEPAKGSTPWAH